MSQPEVVPIELPVGKVLALKDNDIIRARGVPYAVAERFQPPQYPVKWPAAKDCTQPASLCPQLPSRLEAVMGPVTNGRKHDEDCLHVTVTAPRDAVNAPVMVWFHGGAFISGGGDLDCYQPLDLARRGIVCVNVSYRIGVFGFLMIPGIAPAHLGLLDQQVSLRWIQDNIAAFGGDPSNVTLVGQSAGSDSIICLLGAETEDTLFHRAILMSPPLREIKERVPTVDALSAKAQSLFQEDPRTMSVSALLDVQKKLLMDPVRSQVMLFAPALGHSPLPKETEFDQNVARRVKEIPILIGWTSHDGRPFARMMGPQRQWYQLPVIGDYLEALGTWYITKSYFQWPSQAFHHQVLAAGGKSTTYSFQYHPETSPLGSCHCIELSSILGDWDNWKGAAMLSGDGEEIGKVIRGIGGKFLDLWVRFMNKGNLKPGHIVIDEHFDRPYDYFEANS